MNLGRCYGFLGRWREAARVYAELFEHEPLVDREARRLNAGVLRAKPELLPAYLEWGVAEHRTGLADSDADGFRRASEIYSILVSNLPENSPMWWQAKYLQVRVLVDQGDYGQAEFLVRDLKRNTGEFPEEWKERFRKLEEELSTKVFRKGEPPPR
jgi:tetratricopeptide (TPR) repeat protein